MKSRILSGVSLLLLLFFLFYTPGCSLIRRPSPPRPLYARALERLHDGDKAAAVALFSSVSGDDDIYPAALIRGMEASRKRDEAMYDFFLSHLAEILPLYPFLDDYYYFALMRQQADRGEDTYLNTYRDFFELVGEEDLYKELLFFYTEALARAERNEVALRESAALYRRRLPENHKSALEELITSLMQKEGLSLRGPEWDILARLPLSLSQVRSYLKSRFEDSGFWWEAASRFLSTREMQAFGGDSNGYILARRFSGASPEEETRRPLSNLLDDPGLTYPSPLAHLFISLFPDDLRSLTFFKLLDAEAAEDEARLLFDTLLEERRFDILRQWLSAWNREEKAFHPETGARFLYWEAVLGMKNGKLTPQGEKALRDCCRMAPLSYYHIKAARLLNLSPLDPGLFDPHMTRGRTDPKMRSLLKALDSYDDREGVRMIQLSIDNDHFFDNLPLFMDLYTRYQDYDWMILSARYLWKAEGPSHDLLPYLYPMGFQDAVRLHSALPPEEAPLVYGVIHQECRFAPTAVSRAGAQGLMQLMPSTFHSLAGMKQEDPFDIRANISAGTAYLKRLLHAFTKKEYVLAAYNAGPHRLHLWEEEFGPRTPEEFVELIPFPETKGYVSRVITLEGIYRALYH